MMAPILRSEGRARRPEGQLRLFGHATFDIVAGYGRWALDLEGPGTVHLTPSLREALSTSVEGLGWDVPRLRDGCLRPVLNALYGLPLSYNLSDSAPAEGPALDVEVHFHGPFTAVDEGGGRCLFADPIAAKRGVYLWTTTVDGDDRPWYVGQTRRGFGQRTAEHLACMMSGEYMPYDAAALSRGEYRLADAAVVGPWPQSLPAILMNYERLVPDIIGVIRLLRIYVAPLDGDAHLTDRIEGALGRYYKVHPIPEVRNFFSPGIKLPAAVPGDRPIRLVLSSESPIAGLPPHLST